MDIRNGRAIKTLIRNKLTSDKDYGETMTWFREKGVLIEKYKDYTFLRYSEDTSNSEISEFCNSIIYRGADLVCYHGPKTVATTLDALRNDESFMWNDKTIFLQYLTGKRCYLFWDNVDNKWVFSDDKKVESSYKKLFEKHLVNIMSLEPSFTYTLLAVENMGELNGLYLETCHNTRECRELSWEECYNISLRSNLKHPDVYKFEGFEKLEPSDFPVYVIDKSKNVRLLESMK